MQNTYKTENNVRERVSVSYTYLSVYRCSLSVRLLTYALLLTTLYLLHYLPIPSYSTSDILGATF